MNDADDPRLTDPAFIAAAHADGFSAEIMAEIIDRTQTPRHHAVHVIPSRRRVRPRRDDRPAAEWRNYFCQMPDEQALADVMHRMPDSIDAGHADHDEHWVEVFISEDLEGDADPYGAMADLVHDLGGRIEGDPMRYRFGAENAVEGAL